jgi:hypothetical protein
MRTIGMAVLLLGINISIGHAQSKETIAPMSPDMMRNPPVEDSAWVFDTLLFDVAIVKCQLTDGEPELLYAKFGNRKPPAPKSQTAFVTDIKVIKANVDDKDERDRIVSTTVPKVTLIPEKFNYFIPTETNRITTATNAKAFRLDGKPIPKEELTNLLKTPRTVLLLKQPIDADHQVDPLFASLFRDDVLFLYVPKN